MGGEEGCFGSAGMAQQEQSGFFLQYLEKENKMPLKVLALITTSTIAAVFKPVAIAGEAERPVHPQPRDPELLILPSSPCQNCARRGISFFSFHM